MVAGPRFLARLESEVRQRLRVRHVFLLGSGRAALAVALRALQTLSPRREVVVPAYTCFSVPAAIQRAGLTVAPCDVDPSTLDFEPRALERAIGDETLCVVASHLFGIPSDLSRIVPLARDRGAFIVEDAAQALGAEVGGRPLGTLGDVGFFSFDRGKSVTCGSGGMIVTDSDRLAGALHRAWGEAATPGLAARMADVVKMLVMAVFVRPRLYWIPAAIPWLRLGQTVFDPTFPITRMSGAKAAMLAGWRGRLEEQAAARSRAAAYYRRHCRLWNFRPVAGPQIRLPALAANRDERDRILRAGRRRGLGIAAMYPTGIDEIEAVRSGRSTGTCPGARIVADRLITLPTHRFAVDHVQQEISRTIAEVCGEGEHRDVVTPQSPPPSPAANRQPSSAASVTGS